MSNCQSVLGWVRLTTKQALSGTTEVFFDLDHLDINVELSH